MRRCVVVLLQYRLYLGPTLVLLEYRQGVRFNTKLCIDDKNYIVGQHNNKSGLSLDRRPLNRDAAADFLINYRPIRTRRSVVSVVIFDFSARTAASKRSL